MAETSNTLTLVWFRRDLRLNDNEALNAALERDSPILAVYIEDEDRSNEWKMGAASRWWLHHSLASLKEELQKKGISLIFKKGDSLAVLLELVHKTKADAVFWNRRYEPFFIKQDSKIKAELTEKGILVKSFNASLLFEPWDISNAPGTPFQVFTPFWKTCLKQEVEKPKPLLKKQVVSFIYPEDEKLENLSLLPKISWDEGFKEVWKPGALQAEKALQQFIKEPILSYLEARDYPAKEGTSLFSPYLHFGELSPRMIFQAVKEKYGNEERTHGFLRQLGWREFAFHLLYHFPKTANEPLRKEFAHFPWKNDSIQLQKWQQGMTGYPLVDAGMRQLWKIGWMHNRVRMVVGSFLVKDLLISWQEGAKWFFDTLVDADLANNTLGWQWVAGCGADAAPYFRIFNPTLQSEKFDPDGSYIKKWVPELKKLPAKWIHQPSLAPADVLKAAGVEIGKTYPESIVDHDKARLLALAALKQIKE
ncbi:MAG TPA: deoxyribodipyrimidine photo-lyase [Parachlamydiaceae bacterium]|nr:deoxyribodipyrimidine photo-lyase [Parachlamydiaceae bacterium]